MIADVPVRKSVSPTSIEEAAELMRGCAARGESISFTGGGTDLGFGNPPERVDVLLKTEKLTRIVEYAPSDQVITVEAGLTLGALQKTVGAEKQRLALDPPRAAHATVGGVIATNRYGPRRTRFGSVRDLIVGISIVRADGTLVRGGGKVVKNVAGFDLPKLMVGSLGTLGLVASATFRLHPLPERMLWRAIAGRTLPEIRAICRALLERRLETAAVVAVEQGGTYALSVLFEGFEAGVQSQSESFARLLREVLSVDPVTIEAPDDAVVASLDESVRTFGGVRLRVSIPPAFVPVLDEKILAPLRAAYQESRTIVYPVVGAAFVGGLPDEAERFTLALRRARAEAEAAGGHLAVLECSEAALRERIGAFGTLPDAFPIMRRLKERFDPDRRLNPGRFVGGL